MTFARGGIRTLFGQWTKYLIQLAGLVIMSRLLAPAEIGLFAILVAVTGFITVVVDSGLSLAVLRRRDWTTEERSTFWWMNFAIGLLAAAALSLASPAIASVVSQPDIAAILPWFSIVFVLNGASIQFKVEMNLQHQFGRLAAIDVISQGVGLAAGIIVALQGAGVWALVAQQLVVGGAGLIMAATMSGFIPRRPRYTTAIAATVRLGFMTAGTQLINYFSVNLPAIALGAFVGPSAAGYWNRAGQIVSLPLQQLISPLTKVAVPALAGRESSSDGVTLRQAQMVLSYLVCGGLALICMLAPTLVAVVLGPGWAPVVPLLQILSIGAMFQVVGYPFYWLAVARDRMKALALAELPGRLAMMVGAIVFAPYGAIPVAIAYAGGTVLVWLGTTMVLPKILGARRGPLLAGSIVPILVWGGAACGVALVQRLAGLDSFVDNILVTLVALACVSAIAFLFPRVRRDLRILTTYAELALKRGRTS